MSTLTSVGPMIINGMPQPGQPGVPMMAPNHIALSAQYLAPNGSPFPQHMAQNYRTALGAMPGSSSAPTPTTTSTAAINRSQRCGVCRGCQAKPCSQCTYCQDSPQFGGPGVKKQSCIERRCLRVLENRLQRDAPTFKARVGCNNCDDCRMADCQVCLVCLDKRFFDNRYMIGALCAKKRCNNATSLELPSQQQNSQQQQQQQQQNNDRQMMKRSFDASGQNGYDYVMAKQRRGIEIQQAVSLPPPPPNGVQIQQQRVMMQTPNGVPVDANGYAQQQLIRLVQPHQQMQPPMGSHMSLLVPMTSIPNSEAQQLLPQQQQQQQAPPQPPQQQQIKTESNNHSTPGPQQVQVSGSNGATVVTIPHSMGIQNMPQPIPQQNGIYPHFVQNNLMAHHYDYQKMYGYPKYEYYDCEPNPSPQDPYVPPSYSGEIKNEIILQPL